MFQYLKRPDDDCSHLEWVKKAIGGKLKKPVTMMKEQWEEVDEKSLLKIRL